jgi:hypothetical protein
MTAVLSRYDMKPISKLLQDADVAALKTMKAVVALRPRGVLSGHLVIANEVTFVPPATSKHAPFGVRLRLQASFPRATTIFSAYLDNGDIVLEDTHVWNGTSVKSAGFEERWNYVGMFVQAWAPDDVLQGCSIRVAEYKSLLEMQEPEERQVLEFVPLAPLTSNMKRMVWIPSAEAGKPSPWIARRETLVGPDIFSLWCPTSGEKQGLGLVRTLAVSRLLRLHPVDEFRVNTVWNKMFERWEIVGIAGTA